ncbi:AMP-binding protein [Nannocystis bainbridge]|uniref:AMP-binding protein n=1 Tax=Nannocystis bainbridge TaxID=2995303 RepID=A0ABT5DZQ4_9BACT|nr:AMP-binding protein [Nannocystis bainbridge]MDC0719070.1 AMP-binding protein [Nannocystis bainbridge]
MRASDPAALATDAIAAHAAASPERIALIDDRASVTYGALVRRARSFAARLGGGPLVIVADKSIDVVTAMLGAWLAGVVTVPLDPSLPPARLRLLLGRIAPGDAVVRPELRALVADAAPGVVCVAADAELTATLAEDDDAAPRRGPEPERDAYCLFTSGSTGAPKGVRISHANVAAFFRDIVAYYPVEAGARCLNTAPLFFDVSLLEIFFPLAQGATVRLYTAPFYLPARLLALIDEHEVAYLCAVAPLPRRMIEPAAAPERRSQAGCGVDLTVRPVGRGVPTSAWHFAASLSFEARQRSMIFEHNFGGTCNVLDLAVTLGVRRFIHVHHVVFGGGGERDGEARDQVSHVLGEIDPSLVHLASMPFRSPVALHRYALLLREFFAESASGPPPSITAPTLVMTGAADEVAHPAAAAAIGAAIPHASSLVLPDGDHYSMYFDPSIAQTIHDFIAAALERGGPAEITARSAAS